MCSQNYLSFQGMPMNNVGGYMGSQGPMRPGSFPGGPPNNMYGSPHHPGMNMGGMSMGNGGPGPQMGSYGGMRPMGMNQFNGQMGPGYMPGAGGQVKLDFV